MANANNLITISPSELDTWLDRARAERWPHLAIVGPDFWLSNRSEEWPPSLKAVERVIRVNASVASPVDKLRQLLGLTSLVLLRLGIGAEGAQAIAASLTCLTSLNLSNNDIGAKGAEAIAASLTGLTYLDLWNNNIGAEGAKAIAASLTGLTSLNLGGNNIGDEGAKAIAASLTGLTYLDLTNNNIGAEGAKAIAASLTGLTSLNLGGNDIGAAGAEAIAASLTGLTYLDLWNNNIGAEGAKAIAASLTDLTSLNLSNNNIGDEGAKAIAASLTGLTSLNLSNNNIGSEAAKVIAASLTGLTYLDLWNNNIGAEGAKAIAASLTGLTSLNLSNNDIGAEGAKAIAASLTGLTSLNLGGNDIGAEGAKAVAASLTGLTYLDLWRNNVGAEGAKAVAASLTGLTSLNLGGNNIGAEGAKAIAASLTGLASLSLSNNNIGAEGAKAIAASLTDLTSLNLDSNNIGAGGAKALLDKWSARPDSAQLRRLELRDNRDIGRLLPQEALERGDAQDILAAYRSFRRDRDAGTVPLKSSNFPPGALVRAVADRQAVLVLGSGASAHAGLPTGNALLLRLIRGLSTLPRGFGSILDSNQPEVALSEFKARLGGFGRVMDALVASISRAELASVLAKAVSLPDAESPLHVTLSRCEWRAVINLTWDNLAKQYFVDRSPVTSPPMRTVTVSDSPDLASVMRSGERLLMLPFGELERLPTLALTMEEFRKFLYRAPQFQRGLVGLLQQQNFLFVGVDVDTLEQFLQASAPDLDSSELKHYALVPYDPTNEVREQTLARYGVQLLGYERDKTHRTVLLFARQLARAARNSNTSRRSQDDAARFFLSSDQITHVRLEFIGPFEMLDLDFPSATSAEDTAPWSVIFGGNGVGKSCIMRAIALVLAGDEPAGLERGRGLLRAGATQGLIEVQFGNQVLRTQLVRDRSSVIVTSSQQTPVQSGTALVLGFPALRGARTTEPTGPSSNGDARDPDPLDLVGLVNGDVDARLGGFKQWLVNLLVHADDKSPKREFMRHLLSEVIRELVPGEVEALAPLSKEDFIIRVITPDGNIPLDDVSQGMSSIFNWVGILTQRLFSICESSPRPDLEPAIVLIDEIDAHLHPEWQRRLVHLTKKHFPRVQVIATSHSPLLAGALRTEELVVLEREMEMGQVRQVRGFGDPFGLPSQDILLSGVFSLTTDRNPDVEKIIQEYF